MKRTWKDSLLYVLLVSWIALVSGCDSKKGESVVHQHSAGYTCPMHPQVVSDKPGTCPVCHMDLVPISRKDNHAAADTSLAGLVKPSNQRVVSQIRSIKAMGGVRAQRLTLQGVVNYNTNAWRSISSRVSGRIERLYVRYNYQYVNKGQKLMDIYSPDLLNAQQELLYLRTQGSKSLVEAARTKLLLLGASNDQINTIIRTGRVNSTIGIYSPFSGYITERKPGGSTAQVAQASESMIVETKGGNSMNSMPGSTADPGNQLPSVETSTPISLNEGQYLATSQTLFSVMDASTLWAEFFASSEQLEHLKKGTRLQVGAIDDARQASATRINLIQPFFSNGSTFTLLRASLPNQSGRWKVGQLVTASTDVNTRYGYWLPRTAVLHLGTRYIAFVKRAGVFVPAYVKVRSRAGEWVDVGEDLGPDTEYAVNAWFMVDSESFVRVDSLKTSEDGK